MKKFKFVFFFLAVCIFISSLGFTSFAAANTEAEDNTPTLDERYELVYDLGVRRGYAESLTRAEFCEAVATIITYNAGGNLNTDERVYPFPDVTADTPGFEAIKTLTIMGILHGDSDGLFCPNAPITFTDAIIITVRALDMEFMVENNNYIGVAQERKLLKDIVLNGETTLSETNAVKLLYNMLMADVYEYNGRYYYNSRECLYEKLGLTYSEGQITDDGIASLDGDSDVNENQLVIDGVKYYNNTDDKDLLAKQVLFYYITDENNKYVIVSLISDDKGFVEFDAEDIYNYSNYTYTIVSETGVRQKYTLPKDFTLLYNGRTVKFDVNLTQEKFNELMNPDIGSVTLYRGKNGNYSLVRVMSYVNMVVGNTSFIDGYYIYDKYPIAGKTRGIAITDKDVKITVKNLNGNILDKSMIKNNNTFCHSLQHMK